MSGLLKTQFFPLQQTIDNLNIQLDQFESNVEKLTSKKKKMDKDVSIMSMADF